MLLPAGVLVAATVCFGLDTSLTVGSARAGRHGAAGGLR